EEEWLAVVEKDPELSIDSKNGPFFAVWKHDGQENEYWLDWFGGNIYSKNPDEILISKMVNIAKLLDAKVQGDDGELYEENFQEKEEQDTDINNGNMLIYNISSIIEINKDILVYKDEYDNRQNIDFWECRNYWVKHVNESKAYVTWEGQPYTGISENDTNCVGQRDWFADKPYFEFFSNPVVRFEIRPKKRFLDIFKKNWVSRYYPQFSAIREKLEEAGWSTFDLG
ncbi:MAG TPA: hypothetical protein VF941_23405, partial [Clostridia bacterium]